MIAQLGALTIGYDDVGSGVPLVLLHGFPHDRTLWSHQLPALAEQCRCIAMDLRGFGESSVCPPYSMDQYADDVAALLDSLGIDRAVIGGLSMGGYVALTLWRRHPERVRAFVLVDTRGGADTDAARTKRRAQIKQVRSTGMHAIVDELLRGQLGKTTRERQPEIIEGLRRMLLHAPADGVAGALEAMATRPGSANTLESIDVPTLIVVGEEDVLTPPGESRAMHALISERAHGRSQVEVIARAGHLSPMERPAAFNHVVTEFIDRLVVGQP